MWNNWYEQTKAFAENIDKQLNESVGAEVPPESKAVVDTTENTEDDVWNDDFDEAVATNPVTALPVQSNSTVPAKAPQTLPQIEKQEAPKVLETPQVIPEEAKPEAEVEQASEPQEEVQPDVEGWAEDDTNFDEINFQPEDEEVTTPAAAAVLQQGLSIAKNLSLPGANVNSFFSSITSQDTKPPVEAPQPEPNEKTVEAPATESDKEVVTSMAQPEEVDDTGEGGWEEDDGLDFDEEDDDNVGEMTPLTGSAQKEEPKTKETEPKVDPIEEPAVEEPAVEETTVEETAVEETAVEETAVEETAVEETADKASVELTLDAPKPPETKVQDQTPLAVQTNSTTQGFFSPLSSIIPSPAYVAASVQKAPSVVHKVVEKKLPVTTQTSKEPEISSIPENLPGDDVSSDTPKSTPGEKAAESDNGKTAKEPDSGEASALRSQLEALKEQLAQREGQLSQKAEQMFNLQQMYETEKQELVQKVQDTKDEAKKRIQRAKERCEAMEAKLKASSSAQADDSHQQSEIIAALREEGQKLAMKQSEMEKSVRTARGEARGLKEALLEETSAKEKALNTISDLTAELKMTKENLSDARKGESRAEKLDAELASAKADIGLKGATIMSLEQTIKELQQEVKELQQEATSAKQGASIEIAREEKKRRKEHTNAMSDLESKIHSMEKEAAVREDALRHEIAEIRKRWQDAVRRADALSMDVQSSTAPLLRQLESMERQYRARATTAAELEVKLRAELEEVLISNEKLSKERNELKSKCNRYDRQSKDSEEEVTASRKLVEEQSAKIKVLEEKLVALEVEGKKRQEEWAEVERLANEGVSRVRSEMTQSVVESEERYRAQLENAEKELQIEKEKRRQLETQLEELLDNAGVVVPTPVTMPIKERTSKLRKSENQVDILTSALGGLDSDDEYSNDDDDNDNGNDVTLPAVGVGSFAAVEQLTQSLKASKKEHVMLRKRLEESEQIRENLVQELGESRQAKEKLPLFEEKVKELMAENQEKELEIQGLREDTADIREMYRTQLNVLLEEKAAAAAAESSMGDNGSSSPTKAQEEADSAATTEDPTNQPNNEDTGNPAEITS